MIKEQHKGNGWFSRYSMPQLWLGLIGLTFLMRFAAILHPRAIDDEAIYSVVANEMVHGGLPYLDAVERKPPLLFWLFQSIFELGGTYNWVFLHFVGVLWVLATMYALYLLLRDLFNPQAGWIAALLYCLYQPWAYWKNIAFNGEVLMNLPIALALWLCLRPARSKWRPEVILAGALLCFGFLLKQPAAIAAVPLGLYFLIPSYAKEQTIQLKWLNGFVHAALLTLGFGLGLTTVAGILYRQGILETTWFWTFTHHDVPHGISDPVFWIRGGRIGLAFVAACFPLSLATYWSLSKKWNVWQGKKAVYFALWTSLLAAWIGTSASGRFYPHYFIQLIVPMALLAAPIIQQVLSAQVDPDKWWLRKKVWQNVFVITAIGFTCSLTYGLLQHRQAEEAGAYIRQHSTAEDRIFVWGQHTMIYLDAQRRPATRFVACFPLTGYLFGSPHSWDPDFDTTDKIVEGSWDQLFEDLEKQAPAFIADQHAARGNLKYPLSQFPKLEQYVQQNYQLVHKAKRAWIYQRNNAR